MSHQYDVVIIGGGIVGNTLALILANANLQVALVEAMPMVQLSARAINQRTIVLAYSSRLIFESIDCWRFFESHACPVDEIHVSDQGQYGTTKIKAQDEQIPALGYVLPASIINSILLHHVNQHRNITILQPAVFQSYQEVARGLEVVVQHNAALETLTCDLLVAADGHNSTVRKFQNIKKQTRVYDQAAIFCNVTYKRPRSNYIAYERFTKEGPLALLPLLNEQAAVVWTLSTQQAGKIFNLDNKLFLQALQKEFGYRLGRFVDCSQREMLPLALMTANSQIKSKSVLVGNAAHTLHPVAGQGLNLALRDIAVLAEEIVTAKKNDRSLGERSILENYCSKRQADQNKIINLTHSLVGIFSTSLLPIMMARMSGLILLDRITGLKKNLTKTTLGFSGKVPRLACGLTLE